jgi:ABC-type glycerol-3-phosphate transport system substrate-binding protein
MRLLRSLLLVSLLAPVLTCSKPRQPGPLLIWATLSPREAKMLGQVIADFSTASSIPTRLEVKTGPEIESWLASDQKQEPRPDLVTLDLARLPALAGRVQDLAPLMKQWEPGPAFFNAAWAPGIFSDRILYLPFRLSWSAMICNSSALPAPPKTWAELLAAGRDHPGQIGLAALRPEDLTRELVPLIWQAGGDPFDFDNPGTRQAFQFLGQLAPFLNLSTRSFDRDSVLAAQHNGDIILHFNGLPAAQALARDNLLPYPNFTAILPAGPKGLVVGLMEGTYLGVPQSAPHPQDASQFLLDLLAPKVQVGFFEEFGWLPSTTEAKAALSAFDQDRFHAYFDLATAVRALPPERHLPEIQAVWAKAWDQVVYQQLPAEEVLQKLAPELKKWRR